jgi:hypothetical protein
VRLVKRRSAPSAEVRRKLDRFRALRNDPVAARDFAREILAEEANAELLVAALQALGEGARLDDHGLLRALYLWLEEDFRRRDPGGLVRVEVLRILWHLRARDDLEFAEAASTRVERSLNGNGEVIRAAGLALLGVLDPEAAAFRAAATLARVDAHPMNAEPALTAARLLGSLGHSVALATHVLRPPRSEPPEVTAECLRGLAGLPVRHIQPVLDAFASSDNEVLLLGLGDLVVSLEPGEAVAAAVRGMLTGAGAAEVYGFLVAAIVASRRDDLLAVLLETLPREMLQARLQLAHEALQLAPQTDEVRAVLTALAARLGPTASQSPDRAPK